MKISLPQTQKAPVRTLRHAGVFPRFPVMLAAGDEVCVPGDGELKCAKIQQYILNVVGCRASRNTYSDHVRSDNRTSPRLAVHHIKHLEVSASVRCCGGRNRAVGC